MAMREQIQEKEVKMTSSPSKLDSIVVDLLSCPACKHRPAVSLKADLLVCEGCKREFPIIGGIPRMVVENGK